MILTSPVLLAEQKTQAVKMPDSHEKGPAELANPLFYMVGAGGLEPPTSTVSR